MKQAEEHERGKGIAKYLSLPDQSRWEKKLCMKYREAAIDQRID